MYSTEQLATISSLSELQVKIFLPDILQDIRTYANRSFITPISVRDIISFAQQDAQIKFSTDEKFDEFVNKFSIGDIIEFKYSLRNSSIYTIEHIDVDNKYFKVFEHISKEEIECFVVYLKFDVPISTIGGMMKYKNQSINNVGIHSQTLDGYQFIFSNSAQTGYPKTLLQGIKRKLPGSEIKEYTYAGIIL